jgi:hypothetical protein
MLDFRWHIVLNLNHPVLLVDSEIFKPNSFLFNPLPSDCKYWPTGTILKTNRLTGFCFQNPSIIPTFIMNRNPVSESWQFLWVAGFKMGFDSNEKIATK